MDLNDTQKDLIGLQHVGGNGNVMVNDQLHARVMKEVGSQFAGLRSTSHFSNAMIVFSGEHSSDQVFDRSHIFSNIPCIILYCVHVHAQY